MRPRNALVNLLAGSFIAGLVIRYASRPGEDLFTLFLDSLSSFIAQRTPQVLGAGFFTTDVLLMLVILLIIAFAPLVFAVFLGRWGIATYLTGFFAGYFATLSTWPLALLFSLLAVAAVLYGEYLAGS
ncbi:MAG: hypothetical protein LUO86_02460 [Methanomicrobiales archaeon]|nr:hypothetical protein [Methanomicrobiales archaeon]MDD1655384.1 hypothetical protein [Methanomicrobiales archaeon]